METSIPIETVLASLRETIGQLHQDLAIQKALNLQLTQAQNVEPATP